MRILYNTSGGTILNLEGQKIINYTLGIDYTKVIRSLQRKYLVVILVYTLTPALINLSAADILSVARPTNRLSLPAITSINKGIISK